jgi:ATP-dependent protease ClpP protease subunit
MRKSLLALALGTILADAGDGTSRGYFKVVAAADDIAEVYVYGAIGPALWADSVSARQLARDIGEIKAKTIHVRINSEGGVVPDGIAIYNALRGHSARKVGFVDGQAASIASLVLMACDEAVVYPTSLVMVHAPATFAMGNAADFREFADTLDTHARAMAEAYVAKTGDEAAIKRLLSDGRDHWYAGIEAVDFGFADRLEDNAAPVAAEAARVVALTSYLAAVERAPAPVSACLRSHITATINPTVFASLSEVSQQAVIGQLEDPTMKKRYNDLLILATAGNTPAAGVQATAAAPAAPAAPAAAPAAPAAPVVAAAPAAPQPPADAFAQIRARNSDIRALAQPHLANAEVRAYVDGVIADADPAVTADVVGRRILAMLAAGATPIAGNTVVTAGADQRDQTRAAMLNAIQARAGTATVDAQNPYRGHSLAELARECVVAAGVDVRGRDRMEVVGLAFTHSTSDFPGLLSDASRRSVLQGFEEVDTPLERFTADASVPDFKPTTLVGLGSFSNLLKVPEGGEYKYGTFSEQGQKVQVVTYGRLFSITRQAIINDDLGIFSEVPRKMGRAARRTIVAAVFDLITSNPTLDDGIPLFHADHGNLMTGSAISTTSVDQMRVAMAKQKDKDGNIIRMPLRNLLTPLVLGGLARTVRESQYEVSGSKNLTTPNTVRNTFDVIDDGHFDEDSATAWYGAADPAYAAAIVIAYLNGNKTPYLEQHEGFTVDGVAWKVRIDAAPGIGDYRAIQKNPGA